MLDWAPAAVVLFFVSALAAGYLNDQRGMKLFMYAILLSFILVGVWIPGVIGILAVASFVAGSEFAIISDTYDSGIASKSQGALAFTLVVVIFVHARYNRHLANVMPTSISPARGIPTKANPMVRKMRG